METVYWNPPSQAVLYQINLQTISCYLMFHAHSVVVIDRDHSKDIHFYKHLMGMGKKVEKPDKLCSRKTVRIKHHSLHSTVVMKNGIMIFKIR